MKRDVICPFCRAINPPSAYVCIRCFKVMSDSYKVPFWKMQISSLSGTLILVMVVFTVLIFFLSHWLDSVEGEINIKVRTKERAVSAVAKTEDIALDAKAVPVINQ